MEQLMKQFRFSAFCLIVPLMSSVGVRMAAGQTTVLSAPNGAARAATSRVAPAARPMANTSIAPHVSSRPTSFSPRTFSSYTPRIVGQSAVNVRSHYLPVARSLNPTFAAPTGGQGQQANTLDPATRENELRTLATMRERRGFGTQQPGTLDPATRQNELRTLAVMRERRALGTENRTLAAINAQRHVKEHDPAIQPDGKKRESSTDPARARWHKRNDRLNYSDAFRRHWHEWHDHNWWHDHCDTIVVVNTGYYFLDGSYWYPAWGYDPLQTYYDYDGPVYTYSNLLPDEVIANVQVALQDAGYYVGAITGSLGLEMRAALANFQRDYGLPITGAIDEATVETLGLDQTNDTSNFQTDQAY